MGSRTSAIAGTVVSNCSMVMNIGWNGAAGVPTQRPERLEPEMAVQLRLSQRPGDDREVVAALAPDAQQQIDEAAEDDAVPVRSANGQQAELADAAIGRQVRIDAAELLVEREGALTAHGHHADDRAAIDRDEIGVFRVKAIDVPPVGIRRMLRDLLDEGLVGELEDLLEVGRLGRHAEPNGLGRHDRPRLCQYRAPMSHGSFAATARAARRIIPAAFSSEEAPQMRNGVARFLVFLALVALCAAPAYAQTGSIGGKVTAGDGSALPGVTVEARSNVLPTPRVVTTGTNGEYPAAHASAGQVHGHVHALRHAAGDARGGRAARTRDAD